MGTAHGEVAKPTTNEAARVALSKVRSGTHKLRLTDFARGSKSAFFRIFEDNRVIRLASTSRQKEMVVLSADQYDSMIEALKREAGPIEETFEDPLLVALNARFDSLVSRLEADGGAEDALARFKRGGEKALAANYRPGATESTP